MTIRRHFCISLAVALTVMAMVIASVSVSGAEPPERISVAYSKDSVPFHFTDENGQPAGIVIDLWRLWSEKTGIAIDFRAAGWDETLSMVGSGAADVHAGLFYNKDRDKFLDYGVALTKTDTHYFSHMTLPLILKIDALAAYRVGVIHGDNVEKYLKERLPEGAVMPFSDYDAIMKALEEGTLMVFAADTPTALFHLGKNGLLSEFTFVSEKPLYQNDFFFAVQEGNRALIEKINQGMALITDEEKSDINRRWITSGDEESEALVVSIDRAYAPLTFVNSLGRPSGLFVDMWRAWAEQTGRKIQFRASSWTETLEGLRVGEVDIHSGLSFSKERAEWVDFSMQIYETLTRIYHRAGDKQPASIYDYRADVVGTQFDSYQDAEFRKAYPNVRVRSYGTNQELIDALLKDEIKAIVQEEVIMEADLDRLGLRGDITAALPERFFPSTIHAAVLKGNSELLEQIDAGFAAIAREKLADIEKRWVPNLKYHFYKLDKTSIVLSPDEKSWLRDHPVLRIAPDPDFIPIEFFDEQGQYQGLAADFLRLVASRLGVRLETIRKENLAQAMEALRSGEADLIGANVPIDEFKKEFLFTEPYIGFHNVIITHNQISGKLRLKDLDDKEVMVVEGWPEVHILRDQYPDIKVIEVKSTLDALLKIVGKEYDYLFAYYPTVSYLIQKYGLTGMRFAGIVDDIIPAAVMVRKDSEMLRNLIDKALASITKEERRFIKQGWIPGLAALEPRLVKLVELNKDERLFLAEHSVLRVAMDPDWAPVEFVDDAGNYHGISADYLERLEELLDVRFEVAKGLTWQQALTAVEKGELDLFSSMARTPERETRYNFTTPYLSMPVNVFASGGVTYIGNLEALEAKRVAVVEGYATHEWLQANHPKIKLVPVKSLPVALKMLAAGEVDAFVGNVVTTSYYISKLRLNQIRVVGETPYKYAQSMAVRHDRPILAGILQKAINAVPQNEREAIFNRWVSVKYEHGLDYSLLWKILLPAFLVVVLIFYWNRRLVGEVRERKQKEKLIKLGAKISQSLTVGDTLTETLQSVTDIFVKELNVAFARIWIVDETENVLKLQASSGLHTHIEGAHERMPIAGDTKISRVVSEQRPYTSNNIQDSPYVKEKDWAREQGLVSYAGIPMIVKGRSIGAMVLFSREAIQEDTIHIILSIADSIAVAIERNRAEETVLASERKIRAMSDSSLDALIMIDGKASIIFWNPAAERIFGYSAEEVMGRNLHELVVPPEDRELAYKGMAEFVQTGEGKVLGVVIEHQGLRKDGSMFPAEIAVSALQMENEWFAVGTVRDVSDRKRSEEELQQHFKDLKQFERMAIGREERMIDLKEEINSLLQEIGQAKKYEIV